MSVPYARRTFSTSSVSQHFRVREFPRPAKKPKSLDPLLVSQHSHRFRVIGDENGKKEEQGGTDQGSSSTSTSESKSASASASASSIPKMSFFIRPPPTTVPSSMPIDFNRENLPEPMKTEDSSHYHPLLNSSPSKDTHKTTLPQSPFVASTTSDDLSNPLTPYAHLAPPVRKPSNKTPTILTDEQIQQVKNLRSSNPSYWTQARLSKEFNIPKPFIQAIGFSRDANGRNLRKQRKAQAEKDMDKVKETWSMGRWKVAAIREARRELW